MPIAVDTREQIAASAAQSAFLEEVEDVMGVSPPLERVALLATHCHGFLARLLAAIERIQAMLIGVDAGQKARVGVMDYEPPSEHTSALEQEKEQEHEHEQEQEQEMHVEKQTQETPEEVEEPEEPERQKYVRDDDMPRGWALDSLCLPPEFSTASLAGTSEGSTGTAQGFFPAARFEVYGDRRPAASRGPLNWPDYCLLSSDHTSPRWRFESHRRLKNIVVVMEWVPDARAAEAARRRQAADSDGLPAARGAALNDGQAARIARVFEMHDMEGAGSLSEGQLLSVLSDMNIRPDMDEDERIATDEALAQIRPEKSEHGAWILPEHFLRLMSSQVSEPRRRLLPHTATRRMPHHDPV